MATSNFINYEMLPIVVITDEEYDYINDDLENDISNFNMLLLEKSERLYDSKRFCDRQEAISLESLKVTIIPGYYEAAQLGLKNAVEWNYINKTHRRMILKFFFKMLKKYQLSRYQVKARFSNGETWYQKVN